MKRSLLLLLTSVLIYSLLNKCIMYETKVYDLLVTKMRAFFRGRGFKEVPTQSRLSILAACENPHSIAVFDYNGDVWPLPQTGQMWLEHELLNNPDWDGVYCISTSYRQEKNPIPGRHELIFPMFEFESKGNMNVMLELEKDLLAYLGFDKGVDVDYDDICVAYGTEIIENEHESRLREEQGDVVFLKNFPLRTNPFWNMYCKYADIYAKCDVIMYGQETIGSAQRSSDPKQMRDNFYTIEGGKYAEKLFELFTEKRVVAELDKFLQHKFFDRFGGGIGMTRLARAWNIKEFENKIHDARV
jgi:aspartyl/asparaginyl-tRNA synthetase